MPPRLAELKRQELATWKTTLAQLRLQVAQLGGATAPATLHTQIADAELTIRNIEAELDEGRVANAEDSHASMLALVLRVASTQESHEQRLDDLEQIARTMAIWFEPPPRLWALRIISWVLAIAAAYVVAIKEFREFVFDNLFSGIIIVVLLLALAVALQLLVRTLQNHGN